MSSPQSQLEIFIPCDVVTVSVTLGPQSGLSTLEELFLRALLTKESDFHQLALLFGLGERPALDLVFDLWHRGYVLLDVESGLITPAAHVTEATLNDLLGGERVEEERQVMLDRIAGQVLPVDVTGSRVTMPNSRGVAPANYFDVTLADVSTPALLQAMRRVIEKEQGRRFQRGRQMKVLGARLSLAHLDRLGQTRWLKLDAQCFEDEATENLRIDLIDAPLPALSRNKLINRLTRLAEEQPEHSFVKHLRDHLIDSVPFETADDLLTKLRAASERFATANKGTWVSRQFDLEKVASRLESKIVEQAGREANLKLLVSQDDQQQAIVRMIKSAMQQVVLACPWITEEALRFYRPAIFEALDRGTQVFLLWGFAPDRDLDEKSPSKSVSSLLLTEFRQQKYRQLFFVSKKSANIHGKVVIQDNCAALVTSFNFLLPSKTGTLEMGWLAETQPGRACRLAEDALEWVYNRYPEYEVKQRLWRGGEMRLDGHEPTLPDLDEIRPRGPQVKGGTAWHLPETAARLWSQGWQGYCDRAERCLERDPRQSSAQLLLDGEHKDVFQEALLNARHRLLIASDKLGVAVNDRFFRRVEKLLEKGVYVTLLYRRYATKDPQKVAELEARFRALAENPDYRDRFRRIFPAENHAKVLLVDDTVSVSSFNFLSFTGDYETSLPSDQERQRSEVGMLAVGGQFTDDVLALINEIDASAVSHWRPLPKSDEEASAEQVLPSPIHHAQDVLEEIDYILAEEDEPSGDEAVLVDEESMLAKLGKCAPMLTGLMKSAASPWLLLEQLNHAELDPRLMQLAVVSALALDQRSESDQRQRWRQWLAEHCWGLGREDDQLVPCAILCAGGDIAKSETLPAPELVVLRAGWEVGEAARVIDELADRDLDAILDTSEQAVVAIAALALLAIEGPTRMDETVKALHPRLPTV